VSEISSTPFDDNGKFFFKLAGAIDFPFNEHQPRDEQIAGEDKALPDTISE